MDIFFGLGVHGGVLRSSRAVPNRSLPTRAAVESVVQSGDESMAVDLAWIDKCVGVDVRSHAKRPLPNDPPDLRP